MAGDRGRTPGCNSGGIDQRPFRLATLFGGIGDNRGSAFRRTFRVRSSIQDQTKTEKRRFHAKHLQYSNGSFHRRAAMAERLKHCWQFLRPFTLLAPATGMLAGALMALGAEPRWTSDWTGAPLELALNVLAGALLAAALNAYSNGINQIFDVGVDRINKPWRMLPSGKLTVQQAWIVSVFFLLLALSIAFWVSRQTFLIVAVAASLTYIYSAPPLRTKSRGFLANLTVAVPEGPF